MTKATTMTKTIEEFAKQFTDELFAGDDLTDFDTQTEKNDAYVMCMAFGNHLMEQPLSVRLTEEEKERVRKEYADILSRAAYYKSKMSKTDDPICITHHCNSLEFYVAQLKLLERIFGKDFFHQQKE